MQKLSNKQRESDKQCLKPSAADQQTTDPENWPPSNENCSGREEEGKEGVMGAETECHESHVECLFVVSWETINKPNFVQRHGQDGP